MSTDPAEQAILTLLASSKSIAPMDAAKTLAGGSTAAWQKHLPAVRLAAQRLAQAGTIEFLRKGKAVPPEEARGVVRLRLKQPE